MLNQRLFSIVIMLVICSIKCGVVTEKLYAQNRVFDELYESFEKEKDLKSPLSLNIKCSPSEDALAELNEQITLYFMDAVSGHPISNARITLEQNTFKTTKDGCVRLPFPRQHDDLMDQVITAQFEAEGYLKTSVDIHFMAGTLFFNRFSISKPLSPGRLRIVLDWASYPADLDAHFIRDGVYHISYRKMRAYRDLAALDRDDRDGLGPETITIERIAPTATYRFFVQDYTRTGQMGKRSKAHIRVYSERGLERTFVVPEYLKGNRWEVFSLDHGQIKPVE